MAKISDSLAGSKNALAFLDMLPITEGNSSRKYTHNHEYDVIIGGIDRVSPATPITLT